MYKKASLGLAVLLCIQTAVAEESSPWKGEGELGFTNSSGNSKIQNAVSKLKIGYKTSSWENQAKIDILRTKTENVMSAEKYSFDWQTDKKLSGKNYLFGNFNYEDDSFSGYDYISSLSAGYGYMIIDTEVTTLKVQPGVGFRRMQETKSGDVTNEPIGTLGLNFSRKIGSHSTFTQDFDVKAGAEAIHTKSDTAFTVQISDQLGLRLSLNVVNRTDPPADAKKTDTITGVTLVYGF